MDVDIKITEDILFEQQLIAYLTEFMDKHGYKINFSSICTSRREVSIVGESGYVGLEVFYFELKKTDFLKKFGIRGYTLFEKIFKPWLCLLPTKKYLNGGDIISDRAVREEALGIGAPDVKVVPGVDQGVA